MGGAFAAIDFETANSRRESACAVAIVRVEGRRIVAREKRLIRPPTRHFSFTHIHNIAWEDVADAPHFAGVWRELRALTRGIDFFAAHNAGFDRSVLQACCEAHGLAVPRTRFECTVRLARSLWGIRPTKLDDVCSHLAIPLDHHDPLSDALACARIVLASL